jgi:DNA processing protein
VEKQPKPHINTKLINALCLQISQTSSLELRYSMLASLFRNALFLQDFYSLGRVDFSKLLALAQGQELVGGLGDLGQQPARFLHLSKALQASPCRLLFPDQAGWPPLGPGMLVQPRALWLQGQQLQGRCLGIVGTRQASPAGQAAARDLAAGWVRLTGGWVVSGGAVGIDAAAHRGALEAGGRTMVVLGSDLYSPFPACNRGLFRSILSRGGGLLSLLPPGSPSCKASFLKRNGVVAGLVEALVVVEAPCHSGAWSTASFALQYGLRTYKLPHCHPQGGPREGIRRLADPERVLAELLPDAGLETPPPDAPTLDLDDPARRILEALGAKALSLDQLAALTKLDTGTLCRTQLRLELAGLVEECGFNLVRRRIGRNQAPWENTS